MRRNKKKARNKKQLGPPPEGYILVRSEKHGDFYRKKKSPEKATLNDALKASNKQLAAANVYAKAIKDALDPFRKNIEDGTLWNDLVSLFKKQIKNDGRINFKVLDEFECHSEFPLTRFMHREVTAMVSAEGKQLDVEVITYGDVRAKWEKAKEYRQILIVVFYDADLKSAIESKTVFFPLGNEKRNKQVESFTIPDKANMALLALRCDFWKDGSVGGRPRRALEILKVVCLNNLPDGKFDDAKPSMDWTPGLKHSEQRESGSG